MSEAAGSRQFGVIFAGDRPDDWNRYVELADHCGFWGLGVGDSQSIYPDVYVRLTIAAMTTRNLRLGTWVTNPLTRHPTVTAGAISSIDQVSHGRAFLGIGTGDSAVDNLGLRPATLQRLEDYLGVVNELQVTGVSEWEGATVRLNLASRRVPAYIGATGTKALQLAGRIADGVVIGGGIRPEVVQDSLAAVRAGAEAAGRRLEDLQVWWLVVANLAEDDDVALAEIKPSLATFANVAFKSTRQGKNLPPEYADAMEQLHTEYDAMAHGVFGADRQAELCDELGVTPYLEERFAISGTPERFLERVGDAVEAGAQNFWLAVRVPDKPRFLRLWERDVAPQLRLDTTA